jgi:diguanylate cyclase (GGDEF)-like protein/PAS domain S-box-containing protein
LDGENNICDFNASAEVAYSLKRKEVVGNNVVEILESVYLSMDGFCEFLETGWYIGSNRQIIFGKSNEDRTCALEVMIIPFKLPDGSIRGYLLINDISKAIEKSYKTDLLSAVFSKNNEGVIVTDSLKKIEWVNKSFEAITGFDMDEAVGSGPGILRSKRHDGDFYDQIWRTVEEKGAWTGELWTRRKNGEEHPIQLNVFQMENTLYNQKKYIGIINDLTKVKEQEKKIIELIYTDPLTGLKNRSYFIDAMNNTINDASNEQAEFSIIYMDLDNFKMINDTMGHSFGDDVLVRFAESLDAVFNGVGIIGRIGGDEFAILIKKTKKAFLNYYIEALIENLNTPFYIEGKAIRVLFSAGIAAFPIHGETAELLLKNADIAMYKAKAYSGMSYMYYTPHYSANMARELYIENLVISGIERDEFYMVYQPIVSRESGKMVGMEALVRWDTTDNGIINPGEFIPICEKNGTIKQLGKWILERSIKDLVLINSELRENLFVSINVSTVQLFDDDLFHVLKRMIKGLSIKPELIELEITETAYMQDFNKMKDVLDKLKTLGVKVVIDDFGTGYSSFNQLISLEVDKLKIDRSFINKIVSSDKYLSLVSGILSMACDLGVDVVCEGIEENEQLDRMNEISWTYGQGNVFSKPILMEELVERHKEYSKYLTILLQFNNTK